MDEIADYRCVPRVEGKLDFCDIAAAISAKRRIAIAQLANGAWSVAIEKPLHVRQEANEFAVMPLLKLVILAADLVFNQVPKTLWREPLHQLFVMFGCAIVF